MVYTNPKHFGSLFFDVWNSFNNHGGSEIHGGAAIHSPKEAFLALVWTHFERLVRGAIVSNFPNFLTCMFLHVWSACLSFIYRFLNQ